MMSDDAPTTTGETTRDASGDAPAEEVPQKESAPRRPDPRDVEIATLKRRLAELQQKSSADTPTESRSNDNRKDDRKDPEDQDSTDPLQQALQRIAELEERWYQERMAVARARVAEQTGVPLAVVERLSGDSEEELREAAAAVAEALAGRQKPALVTRPKPAQGDAPGRGGVGSNPSPAELAEAIRKRLPY
mgnify:CR=1 FL=1